MKITFPNESSEYRAARVRLLEHEMELRRSMEAVAAERRALPAGGAVPEDYVFDEANVDGGATEVRLSQLFAPGKDSLVLYNYMFPRHPQDDRPKLTQGELSILPIEEQPCPSCTAFIDQLDAAAGHINQNLNLGVVAGAPADHLAAVARGRRWSNLRLLSSARNDFKRQYHGEDEGSQQPMLNVFHRDGDEVRHFWASEMLWEETDPGQDPRHVGTLEMLWNTFDLTPEGRPEDWHEQLQYR